MGSLFHELRRRNVFRVAGVYAVVGWLLAQAAALLENALGMPGWFDTVVVSFLLLGFPIAMIFAWAFELTPEGMKRTAAVPESESITAKTGRTLDYVIIAGLALVVAVVGADRMFSRPAHQGEFVAQSATDNSIAVLPFVDMSPQGDQEYFADGISEELLNVLAKVNTLQVAGRTSSFAFKGQNRDLREIGNLLKVSHILEGSVRKSGNEVRITAQLIKAQDGYHVWSETFDGDLDDIFGLQDRVANAILTELKGYLPIGDAVGAPAPTARADVDAYEIYLRAREAINVTGGKKGYEEARRLLDEAIAIDPNYAPSLAWRAYVEAALSRSWGGVGDTSIEEALPVIKSYADRALAIDPKSPDAHLALGAYHAGLYISDGKGHLDDVIATYREAVALRPNFPQAQRNLASFLTTKGEFEEGIDILESVLAHDPGHREANEDYIYTMISIGRFEEADAALDRWQAIRPDPEQAKLIRAYSLMEQGKSGEAVKLLGTQTPEDDDRKGFYKYTSNYARYDLGDVDWVEDHADGGVRYLAAVALARGETQKAADLIDAEQWAHANPHVVITGLNRFLYYADRNDEIIRYYDETIKTPEAAINEIDACGCDGMETLVAALRKAGHKDAPKLLKLWGDMAARKSVIFARSYSYHKLEGRRHILNGDYAKAVAEFNKAMDFGWRNYAFAIGAPEYRDVPDTEEFAAVRARMVSLINEQRAIAGLEPLPTQG